MFVRHRRWILLSSSALAIACCLASAARSQTAAEPPPAPTPAPAPAQAPAATPPAAQTTPAPAPAETTPAVAVPTVTITEPPPPRRPRPARPARAAAPREAPPPAAPPQVAPTIAPRQPYAPLNTITSGEIQQLPAQSFGDIFFTQPGATSSTFAPGASRPILRGLGDDRIRVQENGLGTGDVAALSPDHAVPIDPLAIGKIEIYRGPSALRYGSQAIGGIVEAINNRIPTQAPFGGVAAEIKTGLNSVDNGWETALLLDAGSRNAAIHADVSGRRTSNYWIPSYPYLFPPDPPPVVNGRQPNSALTAESASAGGSWLFDGGYAGAAVSRFITDYQIPGIEASEKRAHIRLEQTKVTSKGEFRPSSSPIAAIRYWAGITDYKHHEMGINDIGFEQIAGTFLNREKEGKVELETMPLWSPFGAWTSFFGAQGNHQQIYTSGEALLFPARTRSAAAYWFNEFQHAPVLRSQFAVRVENVKIDGTPVNFPANFLPPPDDPEGFAKSVSFAPKSISYSLIRDLPSDMQASFNLQRIERAPRAWELFAKGPHDATQTFDIGNANLTIETATSAEIGLKRTLGNFRFDGKAYYTRFNNFIYQQPTGIYCGEEFATCGLEDELLQTAIAQRDAIFRGAELAWQWDVVPLGPGLFGLDVQYDTVRATFTDGSNVPRIPPQRLGGGAYWRSDNWFVRAGLLHAFAQNDLAPFETPTAGYNLVKAEIVHKRYWRDSPWGPVEVTTGLVGNNLLNVDMRNHAQFRKDEILLPGRGVKFYLNAKFDAERPSGPPGSLKGHKGPLPAMPAYKAPAMAAWSWNGLYAGANGGWSGGRVVTGHNFAHALDAEEALSGGQFANRASGGIFGIQAGYNWMPRALLVGIEGDVQISRQRGSATAFCPGEVCNAELEPLDAPVTASFDHRLPWFGTLRGRIGTPIAPFSHSVLKGGWTVGGGLEAHLGGNWTAKAEYLYMDFGFLTIAPAVTADATVAATINPRLTSNIVRAGINYKLN